MKIDGVKCLKEMKIVVITYKIKILLHLMEIISSNHTTAGSEILKVTSGVVINLRQYPQDRETVIVNCRTDDRIDIVGEINIVNMSYYDVAQYNVDEFGARSIIVEQDDTTLHLVYIQEFKEWLAI